MVNGRSMERPAHRVNARDFRCFRLFGVLWSSCPVSVLVSVFPVVLAVSGHGCCPRVAAGSGARFHGPRSRRAGRFLLPDGLLSWRRLAEAGRERGDLGFPGDGCLGRGGVREFRACFLGAFRVALPSGDVQGVQGGAGGGVCLRRRALPATTRP